MVENVLDIWGQYANKLRSNRRNNPLYRDMARDLERRGILASPKEVLAKINNLTQKYRGEKKTLGTGSTASKWQYYWKVHKIIGGCKCNAVESEDSLMIIDDYNEESSWGSLMQMNCTCDEYHMLSIELCDMLSSRDEETSGSASACLAPLSPITGPSSPVAGPSSPVAGPSRTKSPRRRSNNGNNTNAKLLNELRRSNELYSRKMAEIKRSSHDQMELEKIFLKSTMAFQADLMNYLKNYKK